MAQGIGSSLLKFLQYLVSCVEGTVVGTCIGVEDTIHKIKNVDAPFVVFMFEANQNTDTGQ